MFVITKHKKNIILFYLLILYFDDILLSINIPISITKFMYNIFIYIVYRLKISKQISNLKSIFKSEKKKM